MNTLKEDFANIKESAYQGVARAGDMGIIAWVEAQIAGDQPVLPGSILAGDLDYVCTLAQNGGAPSQLVVAVRMYIR